MFKKKPEAKKPTPTQAPAPAPVKDPALEQAERDLIRLTRIKKLGEEAEMWRKFADGCESGRWIAEDYRTSLWVTGESNKERLSTTMDEDSAPLWRAFALSMSDERQRRMRDLLASK